MSLAPTTLGLVALGGALGAVARYIVFVLLPRETFPLGTLTANTIGAFLAAAFLFHSIAHGAESLNLRAFLAIGVLGAFTTMSTFGVETLMLWTEHHAGVALAYVALTLTLTFGAVALGRLVALALTHDPLGA